MICKRRIVKLCKGSIPALIWQVMSRHMTYDGALFWSPRCTWMYVKMGFDSQRNGGLGVTLLAQWMGGTCLWGYGNKEMMSYGLDMECRLCLCCDDGTDISIWLRIWYAVWDEYCQFSKIFDAFSLENYTMIYYLGRPTYYWIYCPFVSFLLGLGLILIRLVLLRFGVCMSRFGQAPWADSSSALPAAVVCISTASQRRQCGIQHLDLFSNSYQLTLPWPFSTLRIYYILTITVIHSIFLFISHLIYYIHVILPRTQHCVSFPEILLHPSSLCTARHHLTISPSPHQSHPTIPTIYHFHYLSCFCISGGIVISSRRKKRTRFQHWSAAIWFIFSVLFFLIHVPCHWFLV